MTRRIAMWALLALPFFGVPAVSRVLVGTARAEQDSASFKRLTVGELEAKIREAKAGKLGLHIYDNNSRERWQQSHIPGAKWVEYDEVQAGDLPPDKTAMLVFYCANEQCGACHTAAAEAVKLGYKNVYILPQGIMGWEKAKKPLEKG